MAVPQLFGCEENAAAKVESGISSKFVDGPVAISEQVTRANYQL